VVGPIQHFERRLNLPTVLSLAAELRLLIRTRLWAQILAGLLLGLLVGYLLSPSGAGLLGDEQAVTAAGWLGLPGKIFLALIQMMIIPLVVASVVLGVAEGGAGGRLRGVGVRLLPYFVLTTTIAALIGATLATTIRPGDFVSLEAVGFVEPIEVAPLEPMSLPDRVVGLIPSDPAAAALSRSMLQVVVFAILMGIAVAALPIERARPLLELAASVQALSMKVVSWAMLLAPYAVFGLIAQLLIEVGVEVVLAMSVYVATVLAGLAVMMLVYLSLAWGVGGVSVRRLMSGAREVQLLAFATSSSAAVMPLTLRAVEERLDVRPEVSRLVVPLGATINMDGTALYQVVAAAFLAQVFAVDLSIGAFALLIATTVGASIGAPGTPGVGIVILATVLEGVGIPAVGIALILGVDRLLDMSRTVVNVTGDITACLVMQRMTRAGEERSPEAVPAVTP
jgi:proton glutamate symport protein